MPRPGSRRYYREQVRAGGLSPRPSILSPRPSTGGTSPRSRLTAATGNTRHDVRRHKANAELASIQKRISRETERRLKELYEEGRIPKNIYDKKVEEVLARMMGI